MARYIKANRKVAEFLHLESDRNTVSDGNYLLWQADMLAFGPLTQLNETLEQIGGIALLAHEAREEQDGTVTRPLPVPTDPRFIIEDPEPESEQQAAEAEDETGDQSESETGDNENGGEQETIEAGDVGNAEDLLGGDQPEGETQENNENENDE